MTLDSTQLATFQAVVAEGSFEAAATSMRVTPSAVSQRIKSLERAVGQVLVRREKPCRATDAGQALLRLAGQVALLEREALETARGPLAGDRARITVTVVVNADSLATWFVGALEGLPERLSICFNLYSHDQDHTAQMLRDGSAMAAVTAQKVAVQGCRVRRLGAMRYLALAAPQLRERYFVGGSTTAGLASAPMVVFDRRDRLQHRFLATLTRRRLDPPIHYVPSTAGFNEAIRLGLGWGMIPERLASEELASGRCVEVVPGAHFDVPLYWQYWRLDSVALTALTDAVTTAAAIVLR